MVVTMNNFVWFAIKVNDTLMATARRFTLKPKEIQPFQKSQVGFLIVALSRWLSRWLSRMILFYINGLRRLSRCLAKKRLTYACTRTRGYITATARQRDSYYFYYYLSIYINRLYRYKFVSLLSRCCLAVVVCSVNVLKMNKIMEFY